jgi:AcrR family transcriptional regulator
MHGHKQHRYRSDHLVQNAIDPRVSRSKKRILEAAADILTRHGAQSATIERIASQAGVARTTVYRHWESRGQLLMDAFEMLTTSAPEPETEDLRAGLITVLEELGWALTNSKRARMLPALIDAAERDAEVAQLQSRHTQMRREPMRKVIESAIARGELPGELDLEIALDQLSGPLFYRRLVTHRPITTEFLVQLADSAIAGWKKRN